MEDSSIQPPVSQFNYQTPAPVGKSKKILKLIVFVIIIGGLVLGIQKMFFGGSQELKPEAITPTPTEYQFPTDTPEPSISPTDEPDKPTVTPTTKKVNPVDAGTGLDRSTLSVEVQNGSGEVGAASQGSSVLKGFGYEVISIGNADDYNYENTTIRVKSTKINFLALLKKDLGFSYTVGSTSADLSSSSTADALVIIGK